MSQSSTSHQNQEWLERFLNMLAAERGVAKNTLEAYTRDLKTFFNFLDQDALTIDSTHIINYLGFLTEQKRSVSTQSRHLSAIRHFYTFLVSEERITQNPTQLIEGPKSHQSLPKILSYEEIELLIIQASQSDTPQGIRLWAMLELIYASGMRVSELVCLPLTVLPQNLDQLKSQQMLFIKGKGDKERFIPLGGPAVTALESYMKIRPFFCRSSTKKTPITDPKKYLFPSWGKEGHLTRIRFFQQLKELAVQVGIDPEKVSPHVLRHAFATHLLQGGADLMVIQKLLGHATIATTQIYTYVMANHVINLVHEHHPLAKEKKSGII